MRSSRFRSPRIRTVVLVVLGIAGACGACGDDASSIAPSGSTTTPGISPIARDDAAAPDAEADALVNDVSEANCGWAGHGCQGLGCTNGVCNSELVARACRPGDFPMSPSSPCGIDVVLRGLVANQDGVSWLLSGSSLGAPAGRLYRQHNGMLETQAAGDKAFGLAARGQGLVYADIAFPPRLRDFPEGAAGAPFPHHVQDTSYGVTNFHMSGTWSAWTAADLFSLDLGTGRVEVDLRRIFTPGPDSVSDTFVDFTRVGATWVVLKETRRSVGGVRQPTERSVARANERGGTASITLYAYEAEHYGNCLTATTDEAIVVDTKSTSLVQADRSLHAVSAAGARRSLGTLPQPTGQHGGFASITPGTVMVDGESVFVATADGVFRGSMRTPGVFARATPEALPDPDGASARSCHTLATDDRFLYYYVRDRGEIRRVAK